MADTQLFQADASLPGFRSNKAVLFKAERSGSSGVIGHATHFGGYKKERDANGNFGGLFHIFPLVHSALFGLVI